MRNELTESALRFLQKHSVFKIGIFTHLGTASEKSKPPAVGQTDKGLGVRVSVAGDG